MSHRPLLNSFAFPRVFETGQSDLINEFYQPALLRSTEYCRAVGFFSSSLLPLLGNALKDFVANGGRMRLIVSPRLSSEDVEAIEAGYRDRANLESRIGFAVQRNLEELELDPLFGTAVLNLAWLVKNQVIDVKVAVPVRDGQVLRGIYHEKLGFFRDTAGNTLAFQGSANEGEQAVWSNFESVWIYTNWGGPAHSDYFEDVVRMFEQRWTDSTPGLLVVDFSAVPRAWLEMRAPTELAFLPLPASQAPSTTPVLRPYQVRAIGEWARSGHRGILAMATGTGKTLVALKAIESELNERRSVLVAVPTRALKDQWERAARQALPGARIIPISGTGDWLQPGVIEECLGGTPPSVLIGVTNTVAAERFLDRAQKALRKRQFTLIVDEVHHVGSKVRSRLMRLDCDRRLGLSATPEREFDEEGSDAIDSVLRRHRVQVRHRRCDPGRCSLAVRLLPRRTSAHFGRDRGVR